MQVRATKQVLFYARKSNVNCSGVQFNHVCLEKSSQLKVFGSPATFRKVSSMLVLCWFILRAAVVKS